MKKIKLILLAVVILGYHYAQGFTFTVTNKLPYAVKTVRVGVSGGACHDNVHKNLQPGETSVHRFTKGCARYSFNKIEINGFPVKIKVKKTWFHPSGYTDLLMGAAGDASVDIVKETGQGFFVVEVKKWAGIALKNT